MGCEKMKKSLYIFMLILFVVCMCFSAEAVDITNNGIIDGRSFVLSDTGENDTDNNPLKDLSEDYEKIDKVVSLDGKTVMIVGNSMVYYGNCIAFGDQGLEDQGYFYQLCKNNGENVRVIDQTYGGKKLSYIYDNYLVHIDKAELAKVDYLVLSEGNQFNDDVLGTCRKILALFPFDVEFRFLAQPMMYDTNFECLIRGVKDLRDNGYQVVDWGKLVYDIFSGNVAVPDATMEFTRSTFMKENLGFKNGPGAISAGYDGDRNHQNPLSGYITAQMLYSSLTNRSAVLSDYSFCYDRSLHPYFDIDAFAKAHYTGPIKTNFNMVFRSPKDMLGLQKLIDIYLVKEGKHPLVVQDGLKATCMSSGVTRGSYCAVCGKVAETQEYIPSNGEHKLTFLNGVKETCTSAGKTAGLFCKLCGEIMIAQKYVAPIGHKTEKVVTPATLTAAGKTENICIRCDLVYSSSVIPAVKKISLSSTSYTYDGKVKTPSVSITDTTGKKLKKGTDYSLTYSSGRKSVGDYTVKVRLKGNYSGTEIFDIKIRTDSPKKLTATPYTKSVKLSWSKVSGASGYRVYIYDTVAKAYTKLVDTSKTSYTVKELESVKNYKFKVESYKKSGSTVYLSSKYKTVSATTKPATVKLSSLKSKKKSAVLSWKKVSNAHGYQIVFSTSSKFTNPTRTTVTKGTTLRKTVKNLRSGKKYYFKVRAYRTVSGKKIYGSYSSVKSVRIR